MRRDPATGLQVPDDLGELLSYVNSEFDPAMFGGAERKGDIVAAVESMIFFTPGGKRAKLARVPFASLCGQLVVKSAELARARIREKAEEQEPKHEVMNLAGAAAASGDRRKMLALATKLEEAVRDPRVHPTKHAGLKKLALWLRYTAAGN